MKNRTEHLIEASLFSAGQPLSLEELSDGLKLPKTEIKKYLKKLIATYSDHDSALEISKTGNRYSMHVRPAIVDIIKGFAQMEIPFKVLKTAALIAYHQPLKQSELQEMFGAKVYDHVKELHELGLIKKRQDGRTIVLTTTAEFSEYFGIDTTNREEIKLWLAKKVQKKK